MYASMMIQGESILFSISAMNRFHSNCQIHNGYVVTIVNGCNFLCLISNDDVMVSKKLNTTQLF